MTTVDANLCITKADAVREAMLLLNQSLNKLPSSMRPAYQGQYANLSNGLVREALNLENMAQQARQPQVEG